MPDIKVRWTVDSTIELVHLNQITLQRRKLQNVQLQTCTLLDAILFDCKLSDCTVYSCNIINSCVRAFTINDSIVVNSRFSNSEDAGRNSGIERMNECLGVKGKLSGVKTEYGYVVPAEEWFWEARTTFQFCTLSNLTIETSNIYGSTLYNCDISNSTIQDSKVFNCRLHHIEATNSAVGAKSVFTTSPLALRRFPPEIRELIYKLSLRWRGQTPRLLQALCGDPELYYKALAVMTRFNIFVLRKQNFNPAINMAMSVCKNIRYFGIVTKDLRKRHVTAHILANSINVKSLLIVPHNYRSLKFWFFESFGSLGESPRVENLQIKVPLVGRKEKEEYKRTDEILVFVKKYLRPHYKGLLTRARTLGYEVWEWNAPKGKYFTSDSYEEAE
ncbi:hypothetical protein G7Y89_g10064 [Cudoniella acicularis]|uniref:Uncharacterized protein n=1 Tax=Cudoniella acicularis TaxID=354080 RepID=A0A8H4RG82_9HELO|nr:hypothetical protein G7Y89_g10064 [Cudoniella acicularis]